MFNQINENLWELQHHPKSKEKIIIEKIGKRYYVKVNDEIIDDWAGFDMAKQFCYLWLEINGEKNEN